MAVNTFRDKSNNTNGITASALVNHIRCDKAARLLRRTNKAVLDIALDCGYANLGHFYTCFRRRFGRTPNDYRINELSLGDSSTL